MISNYTNTTNTLNFTARPNLKKILPQVRAAFNKTLPDIQSPTRLHTFLNETEKSARAAEITELNNRTGFVRKFIDTLYRDGGQPEHFRGLIGIIKAFKAANCSEYAEITKTILNLNGVKNCDMFAVFAKKKNQPPRALDHAIVALGIKKSHNNKKTQQLFQPPAGTKIIDMWYDGYIGTIKGAHKKFRELGLQQDETILLKPLSTYEMDKEAKTVVKQAFPQLIIKNRTP